ncbi:MAG: hypothetical protein IKV59_00075, partial [Lachnospiraceae bacterium]|nr:hypothetical protein [Lachnospiraceae bacterium]
MTLNMKNPTYRYNRPFLFCGRQYRNSKQLAEAILENWDDAITAFKCGDWQDYWRIYVSVDGLKGKKNEKLFADILYRMWSQEQAVNVDVLFTKVLHCIEPGMKEIPCFIKNQKQVELWNVEAYHDYLCSGAESWSYLERLMKNDLDPDPNRPYHEKTEGMVYMCHMLREQIFSDFGYTDAEKPFLDILLGKTGKYIEEYDCAMAYRKVADHLYEREVFTYKGKLCRELADFADVIWEY